MSVASFEWTTSEHIDVRFWSMDITREQDQSCNLAHMRESETLAILTLPRPCTSTDILHVSSTAYRSCLVSDVVLVGLLWSHFVAQHIERALACSANISTPRSTIAKSVLMVLSILAIFGSVLATACNRHQDGRRTCAGYAS